METSVNNKCKAFTSLEQSKKLAEFLPIESSDMYYHNRSNIPDNYPLPIEWKHNNPLLSQEIPCWSLAALYSILPNNKKETTTLSRGGWKIEPVEYLDNWWCEYEDDSHTKDFTVSADNPIDACYEMIIKLHKQKLL